MSEQEEHDVRAELYIDHTSNKCANNCPFCKAEDKYCYSFYLQPNEKWGFPTSIFKVFECLRGRIEFEWTEEQFEKARSELSHIGLVMHEISRRPYYEEEIVL